MNPQSLYWIWAAMLDRCRNPRNRAYANYGGRGIAVCERWKTYKNFESDMGARPEGMSIDRVDNDGPYSPENCRWVTRTEQNSNRRNCIYVSFDGERITLKEASRRVGLRYRQVHKRITELGWTVEKALSTPMRRVGSGTGQ